MLVKRLGRLRARLQYHQEEVIHFRKELQHFTAALQNCSRAEDAGDGHVQHDAVDDASAGGEDAGTSSDQNDDEDDDGDDDAADAFDKSCGNEP